MNSIFQQLMHFAQNNGFIFVFIVIISFIAIFILTILLLNPRVKTISNTSPVLAQDIQAISGDDEMVTQLDLARAYIELGNIDHAIQILKTVILQGNDQQKQSAQELLITIPK